MCENLTVRRAIKQGSGIPTIPVSTSHQNGDWLPTDIYVGEQYLDTDTGIVYTRNGNDIEIVGGGQGQPLIWKANISQTSTNAPVLNVIINTLGVTAVPSYITDGTFAIDGFDSNLINPCEITTNLTTSGVSENFTVVANTSSQLILTSQLNGVDTNGVIDGVGTTLTVIKY